MIEPTKSATAWRDAYVIISAVMMALTLLGGFDAFLQLSAAARWIVAHWGNLILNPIHDLLARFGWEILHSTINAFLFFAFAGLLFLRARYRLPGAWRAFRKKHAREENAAFLERTRERNARRLPSAEQVMQFLAISAILILLALILYTTFFNATRKDLDVYVNRCVATPDACSDLKDADPAFLPVQLPTPAERWRYVKDHLGSLSAKIKALLFESTTGMSLDTFNAIQIPLICLLVAYLYFFHWYVRHVLEPKYRPMGPDTVRYKEFVGEYLTSSNYGLALARIYLIVLLFIALSAAADHATPAIAWLRDALEQAGR